MNFKKLLFIGYLVVLGVFSYQCINADSGDAIAYGPVVGGSNVFRVDQDGDVTSQGTLTQTGAATFSSDLSVAGDLVLTQDTLHTFAANGETVTIDAPFEALDAGGTARTGVIFSQGSEGQIVVVHNEGGELLTFDTTETVSNVFGAATAGTDSLTVNTATAFIYSDTDSKWHPISTGNLE